LVVGEDYCDSTLTKSKFDSSSKVGFKVKPIIMCVAYNYTYR
jgi:hypothetical protein